MESLLVFYSIIHNEADLSSQEQGEEDCFECQVYQNKEVYLYDILTHIIHNGILENINYSFIARLGASQSNYTYIELPSPASIIPISKGNSSVYLMLKPAVNPPYTPPDQVEEFMDYSRKRLYGDSPPNKPPRPSLHNNNTNTDSNGNVTGKSGSTGSIFKKAAQGISAAGKAVKKGASNVFKGKNNVGNTFDDFNEIHNGGSGTQQIREPYRDDGRSGNPHLDSQQQRDQELARAREREQRRHAQRTQADSDTDLGQTLGNVASSLFSFASNTINTITSTVR